jgi:acetyl-CoA carboxylase biotin carboxyl carrier protein
MVRLPENSRGEEREQDDAPSLAALSQEVKELVRLISSTDVSELHLESGQVRITIKRGVQQVAQHPAPAYAAPQAISEPAPPSVVSLIGSTHLHGEELAVQEGQQLLVAPMVGTFYAAPAPGSDPYVSEGEVVEPGQIVGIIEAMKMMNEIESEWGGRITRILVQNAQPVEYGQPLMVIQVEEA